MDVYQKLTVVWQCSLTFRMESGLLLLVLLPVFTPTGESATLPDQYTRGLVSFSLLVYKSKYDCTSQQYASCYLLI